MRIFLIIITLLLSGLPAQAQLTSAEQKLMAALMNTQLFEDAVDYTEIPKIEDCEEFPIGPPKFHECRDSRAIYDKALANAKEARQPLMVIFGFDTCPACRAMDQVVFDPKNPMTNGHIVQYFSKPAINKIVIKRKPVKISLVRIHSRSKHGLKLADELGATKMATDRGWHRVWSPFILFVNPQTGQMHSESYWEAKELFCDWGAELAVNIEGIGYVEKGTPYAPRERCKN